MKKKQALPKIHLACSIEKENLKYIRITGNFAYATNGYILAQVDLTETSILSEDSIKQLNGKYIHMDTWKYLSNSHSLTVRDGYIDRKYNSVETRVKIEDIDIQFPNFNNLYDSLKSKEKLDRISLDFDIIGKAAMILEEKQLSFDFYGSNRVFVIYPVEFPKKSFVIAIGIEEKEFTYPLPKL